jgi:hypothetical protein
VSSRRRPAPGGGNVDLAGHSYGILEKALARRNVVAALAAARELSKLSLLDPLELTMLIARKDPSRYPRVAARWLQRLLEEHPDVTISRRLRWPRPASSPFLAPLPGGGADAQGHGRNGH